MPESLKPPSANQIRQELQDLILRDLLGPAGGNVFLANRLPRSACVPGCGKHLVGFAVENHTQKVHADKDLGYRKM